MVIQPAPRRVYTAGRRSTTGLAALFADIPTDMTDDEMALSRSTPSARFDVSSSPAAAAAPIYSDPEAEDLLAKLIAEDPVVLFALEWCEFCWSLRRFLDALQVPYRVVALDAFALQADDLGLRVRRALTAKTGASTIPQMFVAGEFVGGCSDVFEAYSAGRLHPKLETAGVSLGHARVPAQDFLPQWLQPR